MGLLKLNKRFLFIASIQGLVLPGETSPLHLISKIMAFKKDQIFYLKYFLPCIALVLTYVVIGQYYMTTLTENDLINVSAKVVSIEQDRYKHGKYTDDRITIILDNKNDPYYFFDHRADFFPTVMAKIQIGDLITLSHRTKMQATIGTGSEFKIMKIQKGAENIYSFERAKQTFSSVGIFTIFAAIGLWGVFFYFRNRIKLEKDRT